MIILPIDATKNYNVVGVHLNEPECVGKKNATHWILTTQRYVRIIHRIYKIRKNTKLKILEVMHHLLSIVILSARLADLTISLKDHIL